MLPARLSAGLVRDLIFGTMHATVRIKDCTRHVVSLPLPPCRWPWRVEVIADGHHLPILWRHIQLSKTGD